MIQLLGNKTDLADTDSRRVVKKGDGRKLAVDNGTLFYECSAMSGQNVDESMNAMAK